VKGVKVVCCNLVVQVLCQYLPSSEKFWNINKKACKRSKDVEKIILGDGGVIASRSGTKLRNRFDEVYAAIGVAYGTPVG